LSQCAIKHTRLESMFQKKHTPHTRAHPLWQTHASHIHAHDTMYANVHICTHCRHMGHLVKFCYDRLQNSNFVNKFV